MTHLLNITEKSVLVKITKIERPFIVCVSNSIPTIARNFFLSICELH